MSRLPIVAALAVLLGAAGPSLPLPPTPPVRAHPPTFEPAPVPDAAITPPVMARPDRGVSVTPELFRQGRDYQGNGYLPGSTVYGYQERNVPLTPGFALHIPLR